MSKSGTRVQDEPERAINKRVAGFLHKPVFALLSISFLTTLNLLLFLPFVIYEGNIDELPLPFQNLCLKGIITPIDRDK